MPPGAALRPRPLWRGALVFCLLLGTFAAGFLAFGEWGGWYYDGTSTHTRYQYDYDRDAYDPEQASTGSEAWDSDGLFTEGTLAFPLGLAILALLGAGAVMARLALQPAAAVRRSLILAGSLAAIAALALGVEAIVYASSMADVDDWWFGSAFYAGLINSSLLAIISFALLAARKASPIDPSPSLPS